MAFRGGRKKKCWREEKNKSEELAELEKPGVSPAEQVFSGEGWPLSCLRLFPLPPLMHALTLSLFSLYHCHCPSSGTPRVASESTQNLGTISGKLGGRTNRPHSTFHRGYWLTEKSWPVEMSPYRCGCCCSPSPPTQVSQHPGYHQFQLT